MLSVYERYYFYLITVALLLSFYIIISRKASVNNYLLLLINAVSLAVEIYAVSIAKDGKPTVFLYNLYNLAEINLYLLIVRNLLAGLNFKRATLYALIAFNIIAASRLIFFGGGAIFDALSYAIGCFLLCCSCIIYFYELFEYKYAVFILQEPSFWLITALLFYYTLGIPIYGVWTSFIDPPKFIIENYLLIIDSLNFVVYLLINLALLCQIRYNKPITLR